MSDPQDHDPHAATAGLGLESGSETLGPATGVATQSSLAIGPSVTNHSNGGFAAGAVVADCFRIEEVLGHGGMGIVYRATHLRLDRQVALKVHRSTSPVDQARLEREAKALAKLAHPHVIGIYDVRSYGEGLLVAMEYVSGGSARAWLAKPPASWKRRLDICVQAAKGLSAAHRAGLVHRDFKPENILITEQGRAMVADFGLARAPCEHDSAASAPFVPREPVSNSDQLTTLGAIVGTPAYMAPEQFTAGAVDARADQFALCIVMHEALYGVRPFSGRNVLELAYQASSHNVVDVAPGDVPDALRQILLQGLQPDPARRFASIDALLRAIDVVLRAPARQGIVLATVLSVAALALVVAGAVLVYRYLERSRAVGVLAPAFGALPELVRAAVSPPEFMAAARAKAELVAQGERRREALAKLAAGDNMFEPEFGVDLQGALEDDDVSMAAVVGATQDKMPFQRAAWDGRTTLECGMNSRLELRDISGRVARGPAVRVALGCALRIINCDIEAETIVQGTGARLVHIEGGSLRARKHLVELGMGTQLVVRNVRMDQSTSGAAVKIGMRAKAELTASTLKGEPALDVGMHGRVVVTDSRLVSDTLAVSAAMHANVGLRRVELVGEVRRQANAVVEVLGSPVDASSRK